MRAKWVWMVLACLCGGILAQAAALPATIEGRWEFRSRTEPFRLEEIVPSSDGSFSARLTWATLDPACAIRKQSVVGQRTQFGIVFQARTRCDVEFSAQLDMATAGAVWTGVVSTRNRPEVLTARITARSLH